LAGLIATGVAYCGVDSFGLNPDFDSSLTFRSQMNMLRLPFEHEAWTATFYG
jgi:hypothetical protein